MSEKPRSYTQDDLMEALNAVQLGNINIANASDLYGIPSSTLSVHLSGYIKSTAERLGLVVVGFF